MKWPFVWRSTAVAILRENETLRAENAQLRAVLEAWQKAIEPGLAAANQHHEDILRSLSRSGRPGN